VPGWGKFCGDGGGTVNPELHQTIALLQRTPAALQAQLAGLPEGWTTRNEGDGTWTVVEVIGHLIHCEVADWMPRVTTIMEHGESRTFDPLDRQASVEGLEGRSIEELLEEFSRMRESNLSKLKAMRLSAEDMQRTGRHPRFGVVTLSQLLSTWAVHDLTHVHQISRIMAHEYREAVGPWVAFLGVLRCDGHSGS